MYRCINMLKFFHNTMSTSSTLYEQTFHAMLYKVFFFCWSISYAWPPFWWFWFATTQLWKILSLELRALCFAWPIFNNYSMSARCIRDGRYPTSASGVIVLLKTTAKYWEFFPTLFVKTTNFQLVFNFEQMHTVSILILKGMV